MSGILININQNSHEDFRVIYTHAMRLVYPYRHNFIKDIQNEKFNIISINNPAENCIYEDSNWYCYLYGRIYSEEDFSAYGKKLSEHPSTGKLEDVARGIHGSFIIFLWNKQFHKFHIITDPIGSIQSYILQIKDEILISTEWKSFVGYKGFSPEINTESVLNTLLFGRVKFTLDSFCRQCITCLPGSIVTILDNHQISQQPYSKYQNNPKDISGDIDELAESEAYGLRNLVNSHLRQFKRPALFLSGGMDSRLLAASISEENKNKLTTVSFGMKGNDESRIANEVAKSLNLRHIDFELTPQHFIDYANANIHVCEGQDLFAQGYLLYICDQLRRDWDIDSVLDGMEIGVSLGGDFLREEFKSIKKHELSSKIFNRYYLHKNSPNEVFIGDVHHTIEDIMNKTMQELEGIDEVFNKFDYLYVENYTREVMRLRHRLIRKSVSDIMLISDQRYLDMISRIPLDYKIGRKIEIEILKLLNPDLLQIQFHNTMMPISVPADVSRISKEILSAEEALAQEVWKNQQVNIPFNHYYTNFSEWFRSDRAMKEFVSDNLLSSNCRVTDHFINKSWLHKIINEHLKGIQDHRSSISYLLTIELFLRQF